MPDPLRKIIIALDGYSSCGKSSTAKAVAKILHYTYIDTGAMYRAVTLYFLQHYINLTDPKAVAKALSEIEIKFLPNPHSQEPETYLNGLNVEKEIRKMHIADKVSDVSTLSEVRRHLVYLQQKMGKQKGLVMDGRDIGTAVFPEAELKIFMTADLGIRAARRQQELLEKKQMVQLDEIIANLAKRDHIDSTRKESPLRKADDAHEIDTSYLTFEEQVEMIINMATSLVYAKPESWSYE